MAYIPTNNFTSARQANNGKVAVSCQTVLKVVNEYFDTTTELLIKKTRKREIVYPRQVAMYLMGYYTVLSLKGIGVIFGKDHTTVIYAIESVESWMKSDDHVKEQIKILTDKILNHGPTRQEDIRGGA